jgi:hypothetical protein
MAQEDIVFKVELDKTGEGGKSLKALKKDFNDLQKELDGLTVGTKKYNDTLVKLGAVKDEIGDLRDTINALNPEGKVQAFQNVAGKLAGGFQAATGAAALFGVQSEELEKQLLKVQAATALAEGIRSVSGLSDSFQVLSVVVKTQVVGAFSTLKGALLATGIGALVVALGVAINEIIKYNEKIDEEWDKQRKLNEELKKTTDEYMKQAAASEELRNARAGGLNELERELDLLEASGASAQEIADKKAEILDGELYNLKVRRATIAGDAELEGKLTQQILDKENEKQALILANEKRKRDEAEKTFKDAQDKLDAEAVANYEKLQREIKDNQQAAEKNYQDFLADRQRKWEDEEKEKIRKEKEEAERAEKTLERQRQYQEKSEAERAKFLNEQKKLDEEYQAAKIQIEQMGFSAAKGLSDAFFAFRLNAVKKGSKEELNLQRQKFNIDKAFSAAQATVEGIRLVTGTLAATAKYGPEVSIPAGIAAGVVAAANVAKILATKFDGGSAKADIGGDLKTSSGSAPRVETSAPRIIQNSTRFDENGRNLDQPLYAITVETQGTAAQERVRRLKDQASF